MGGGAAELRVSATGVPPLRKRNMFRRPVDGYGAHWLARESGMRKLKHWFLAALLLLATTALAQSVAVPRIGWVLSGTPENSRHLLEAIRSGLADEGLVDGRNVTLDVRFNAGRSERYTENFGDLIRTPVSVLAASGYAGISAARDASGGRIPVARTFAATMSSRWSKASHSPMET